MPPQDDGTKVPLTDGDKTGEVKSLNNNQANGDAKVNISNGKPIISGRTKAKLLKCADDPRWETVRWVLFGIFWVGWFAMLGLAMWIINQAPRCPPKKTLDWMQKSAILQYDMNYPVDIDGNGEGNAEDLVKMAAALGMDTVYLDKLISRGDFEKVNTVYNETEVMAVLKAAEGARLHVVTDFLESPVDPDNTWYRNENMSDFFDPPNSRELDFSNSDLLNETIKLFSTTWKDKGVLGYLAMDTTDETLINATVFITEGLKGIEGIVAEGMIDVNHHINTFTPLAYKEFLEDTSDKWSYYKFNPFLVQSTPSESVAKLVTTTLFLVPGTPILHGIEKEFFTAEKDFIKSLSDCRDKKSVQIGNMTWVNNTSDEVIAFARVKKGTEGCAVAVNFHNDNSTEVDFSDIKGIPEKGNVHIRLSNATFENGELGRMDLSKVVLQPLEGVVVLFWPDL